MNQTENLVKAIINGLQDKKGKKIVTVNLSKIPGAICQYMVICEGNTPSQVGALADSVWEHARVEAHDKPISTEGEQKAEWIGMDYGTVLVHIFLPELRKFYNLDNLWSDARITEIPDLD